mgnify:CR=1 FL=1
MKWIKIDIIRETGKCLLNLHNFVFCRFELSHSPPTQCPVQAPRTCLYIKISFENKIFNISDKSVALILKKYASKAGLDSTNYSGHSLRSGFATSAAELGAEERSIMAMTGHKTTQMVRRYIREANLFKNNALNKIKI